MTDDRERWDAKWAQVAEQGTRGIHGRVDPDPFVLESLARLDPGPGATALDLAAGAGRHALELARRGCRTSAWDVSPVGLGLVTRGAAAEGLAVTTRAVDAFALAEDPPAESFALVVAVDFLIDEALQPLLRALVAPGGHACLRTFTRDWPGEKPPGRFRLAPGALAAGIEGFETVLAQEEGGRAGLLARRAGTAPGRD